MFRLIGLIEFTMLFYEEAPPIIFVEGQYQIDRVWSSPRIYLYASSIALFYLWAGDYRIFIVDFLKELLMDKGYIPLCKPSMR